LLPAFGLNQISAGDALQFPDRVALARILLWESCFHDTQASVQGVRQRPRQAGPCHGQEAGQQGEIGCQAGSEEILRQGKGDHEAQQEGGAEASEEACCQSGGQACGQACREACREACGQAGPQTRQQARREAGPESCPEARAKARC
jgi:hypothetical protein